jgi:lysozyme
MPRKISTEGLNDIKRWEGKYLTAYQGAADRPGLLTIGYGHTSAAGPPEVVPGMKITEAQANQILRDDLANCEAAVERLVEVPLNDNQFAALVSFVFNVGEGAFAKSTLLKKLNRGDYESVPSELMKWTRANGKYVQGLANRRAVEAGRWSKGALVSSQYIEPEEVKPSFMASPEALAGYTATGTGIVSTFSGASGPIAWAMAAVIVIAALVGGYFLFQRIKAAET